MKVVRFEDCAPAESVGKGFRGNDIQFRDLLSGEEGSPGNYGLQWVEVASEYHAPRHRHNFEQIRIMMEGSFGFGPDQVQDSGSVGYFCEGTYYTQKGIGRSVTLLLQVGGPSGAGFMSRRQLRAGIRALAEKGQFHDGIYTWHDESGKKHNQDSYEAAWEHVHARPLVYPKPMYAAPVLMRPERFAWLPVPGSPGAAVRKMARFHERGLEIGQLHLLAGTAFEFSAEQQSWLLFTVQGDGRVEALLPSGGSATAYKAWTSMEVQQHEVVTIKADTDSTFWMIGLPLFEMALEEIA